MQIILKLLSSDKLNLCEGFFKNKITITKNDKGKKMRYNDQTLNPELDDIEVIPNIDEVSESEAKTGKKIKAHVVRRNVEDYLERKALEQRLKEVFDDDYLLD